MSTMAEHEMWIRIINMYPKVFGGIFVTGAAVGFAFTQLKTYMDTKHVVEDGFIKVKKAEDDAKLIVSSSIKQTLKERMVKTFQHIDYKYADFKNGDLSDDSLKSLIETLVRPAFPTFPVIPNCSTSVRSFKTNFSLLVLSEDNKKYEDSVRQLIYNSGGTALGDASQHLKSVMPNLLDQFIKSKVEEVFINNPPEHKERKIHTL